MEEPAGIVIQGKHYLLVEVGGGNAVHLAPTSGGNQRDLGTRTVCRAASQMPAEAADELTDKVGVPLAGEDEADEAAQARKSALGALFGFATGIGLGAAFGALRPVLRGVPTPVLAAGVGLSATAASSGPLVALGFTDPTEWGAQGWISDPYRTSPTGWRPSPCTTPSTAETDQTLAASGIEPLSVGVLHTARHRLRGRLSRCRTRSAPRSRGPRRAPRHRPKRRPRAALRRPLVQQHRPGALGDRFSCHDHAHPPRRRLEYSTWSGAS